MKTKKQKRIKQVFSSSSEVLHLWANQSQQSARQSGSNSRFGGYVSSRCYFEDLSCYSYGSHYELGRLVTINKQTVALINTSGYSPTTGKHINEARSATSHMLRINVDSAFDWKQGLLNMQGELVAMLLDQLNQRTFYKGSKAFDHYIREQFQKFNQLCVAVGMPQLQLNPPPELIALIDAHIKTRIKRSEELKSSADERRQKYLADTGKREAAALEAWLNGTGPIANIVKRQSPQLIRVKNGVVETSKGAKVNLSDAIKLLNAIRTGSASPGQAIGPYTFNGVTPDKNGALVKIGCHTFDYATVRKVLEPNQFKLVVGGKS